MTAAEQAATDPAEPAWLADCSPEMRAGWHRGRQIAAEHPISDDLAQRLGEIVRRARAATQTAERTAS